VGGGPASEEEIAADRKSSGGRDDGNEEDFPDREGFWSRTDLLKERSGFGDPRVEVVHLSDQVVANDQARKLLGTLIAIRNQRCDEMEKFLRGLEPMVRIGI